MENATESLPAGVQEMLGGTVFLIVGAVLALVFVFASCRIFAKAGFPASLGFLMLVPVVNLFGFLYLAFARWPVRGELHGLRKLQNQARKIDRNQLKRAA